MTLATQFYPQSARDAYLNLLAAVMVADRRIVKEEVLVCEQTVRDHFGDPNYRVKSDVDFVDRCQAADRALRGPGRRSWLGLQHLRLKDYPDHAALLKGLWHVAVSDHRLDSRETTIIDMMASLWQRRV